MKRRDRIVNKAAGVKIIRLVKRRADLTLAQFRDYWLTRHALHEQHAMATTPLQRVVASIATGEVALGGTVPPFDGMVALYFRSIEDARATLSGPETAAMREDAKNFVDPRTSPQIFADEYLVSEKEDAPGTVRRSGQLKTIRTISRRRDLTHAQFKDYWLNQHSKLEREVIETTSMQRIIASFALPGNPVVPEFDGLAELYFAQVEDIRAMFAGPVPGMMRKDEENFVQMNAPAVRLVAEEYVIGEKGQAT
jgi:uncharacterized protein (TIGR02118 family)